jgi:hypothetical protein
MNPAIFIGEPLFYKQDIKIYPPKVRDVLGRPRYAAYAEIFTTSQEDIWDMIAEKQGQELSGKPVDGAPTPFEFFLNNCFNSPEFMQVAIEAFELFTHERVRINPEGKIIIFTQGIENIKDVQKVRRIEEEDYFTFQNLIRQVLGNDPVEPPRPNENPKVALIKAKGRLRERIKKKNGNKNGITFETMLVALCCMNLGLTPLNIGEIPYPSASVLFTMCQDKEKYETDLKIATAGFGNKKVKPKYWIKNSDNK